jgi:Domain of unknown function (DUF4172)
MSGLSLMICDWQKPDWPDFTYGKDRFDELEAQFLRQSEVLPGSYRHVGEDDKAGLSIELMTSETFRSAALEKHAARNGAFYKLD